MPTIIPETVAFTFRALRIVHKFGAGGCSIAQYGAAAYSGTTWAQRRTHNAMGSQVLLSLERRGMVIAIGEDPSEALSPWAMRLRKNRRTYVISEAGEAYLKAQVDAATGRARELARKAAPPSPDAAAQERDRNAVGGWDP